jgi:hypothetical protein
VLGCLLGCVEEFLCLVWTYLLEREVTYLAVEECLEIVPVWSLGVELEWVLRRSSVASSRRNGVDAYRSFHV